MLSQKHFKLFGWLAPVIVGVFMAPNFGAAQNIFTHVHLRVPDTVEAGMRKPMNVAPEPPEENLGV